MDFKNICDDLQIVKIIVSQWAKKYNIDPLEYTLVINKLEAITAEPAPVDNDPVLFPDEKEEPAPAAAITTEEDDIPTMSEIEKEIIMHEMGGLPDRMVDAEAAAYGKRRSERQSLKSLYYDEKMTSDEKAIEAASEQTISEMAAEINRTVEEEEREALPATEPKKVLGDIINSDTRTISDTYKPKDNGIVSNITSKETLRKAIGLNDRYLLIRDLFRGDPALYEETVTKLDSFDDLDDAMLYIHDNFHWDPNGEGSRLIVELLVNKLS